MSAPSFEEFAHELFKRWISEDCCDVDGAELQDLFLDYGLAKTVPYDPEKHGENNVDAEAGDDWLVWHRAD